MTGCICRNWQGREGMPAADWHAFAAHQRWTVPNVPDRPRKHGTPSMTFPTGNMAEPDASSDINDSKPRRIPCRRPRMSPAKGTPQTWQIPPLTTTAALADWLGLTHGELDWFADCQGREVRMPAGNLRHYVYHWLRGRAGKRRLLEMPKRRLKDIQRRLLHHILDPLNPHPAAP